MFKQRVADLQRSGRRQVLPSAFCSSKGKKELGMDLSRNVISIFLSMVLIFSGCASTTDYDLSQSASSSTHLTEEQVAGEQIHREILSTFYPYTDPKVVQYVNEVGQTLTRSAKRQDLHYRFTILYNEKIYATSAPGGYIYTTTGLLNFLENEAELAAVLAHEIAEQQYQDPRFKKTNELFDSAVQAGASIGPMFGPFGSLAALGLVFIHAYAQGAQKTPEQLLLESDVNAMKYLLAAGYDPQALLDVLQRFLRAGEKLTPFFYDYYQSRPITEERMINLQNTFRELPLTDKTLTTDAIEYQQVTKGVREIYRKV